MGFAAESIEVLCRQELNDPPTAMGGIRGFEGPVVRQELNDPPTAVGGIRGFISLVL